MLSERADGAPKGYPFPPARPIPYKGQGKRKELLMNQPSLRYRQRKKTPDERPVRNPGGNIACFFFFDDTDISLRRLPAGSTDSLAESDFIRIYTHYFVMEFLK
jgi:hypothetical protein